MTASAQRQPHTSRIVSLAWPILIGQLAVVSYGVMDTAMTSRYSSTDLAALALGASIYISIFVGLSGVLQALSPIVGQLYGGRRLSEIGVEVKQSIWLALFLSLAGAMLLLFPQPLLAIAQVTPELADKITLYLRLLALALPATLGLRIYSAMNTALGRPKMVMAIQVGALLLKIPLNTLFIFGGLGLPAFGGPGCAIATAITSWVSLLFAWMLIRRDGFYRRLGLFGTGFIRPRWAAQRELLRLGVPMGLSYLIEVTAFTFMALFIARLGETAVAGHQVTANFSAVLYMLPLSIANATGILVAQNIGSRELIKARHAGNDGIRLAVLLSCVVGVAVFAGRAYIIRAYTPDPLVIAVAMPLFVFIGFYQLFDALQITTAFVLRAYKVAVVPTLMYALALWGAGLGGGYMLGLDPYGIAPAALHGPVGFWLANSFSLGLVGFGLLWYLRRIQRQAEKDTRDSGAVSTGH